MEQSALNDEEKEPDDDEWSNFEDFDDPIMKEFDEKE